MGESVVAPVPQWKAVDAPCVSVTLSLPAYGLWHDSFLNEHTHTRLHRVIYMCFSLFLIMSPSLVRHLYLI